MIAAQLIALLLAQTEPTPLAELELFLVEDGVPLSDAALLIDGVELARTDEQGSIVAKIPAGRREMSVVKDDATLVQIDLLTDEGELVLIIATIKPGESPELLIESSGGDSVIASGANATTQQKIDAAQKEQAPGALTGRVLSAEEKAPIPNAQLFFSGITIEVQTNKDGEFSVELPAGVYSVSIVHPRFSSQTLENIRVIPERQVDLDIELTPAGVRLQDYVVTAPYVEGSIASVIEQQRAASGVSDVLGAAQISATGDSNAAQALTRVTGLTVEDGKFVLIRGQPSRFTLALFNGSPLPSPEPLLRVVPLDLFPTGVLQGIEVQKSYSADKPGAFGAGLIQLNTRGVPEESFLKLSISTSYNDISALEDGLSYEGGGRDFLGLDDGTRALPDAVADATEGGTISLNDLDNENELGATFPNILDLDNRSLPLDIGFGASAGSSFEIPRDGRAGVIATIGYSNRWRRQERIQREFVVAQSELSSALDLVENRTDNDVSVSGLLTGSVNWDNHTFQSNTFVVNQSQQRSQFTTGRDRINNLFVEESLLSWIERFLVAQQFTGRHDFEFVNVEYRALFSQASRDAPDRREYTYSRPPAGDVFRIRDPSGLLRSYDTVDDSQWSVGLDVATDLFADESSWLRVTPKIGVAFNRTSRDAQLQRFLWQPNENADATIREPEVLFDPSETGASLDLTDLSIRGADDSFGSGDVFGTYALVDVELGSVVRVVGGVRYETSEFLVETLDLTNDEGERIESGFDQADFLPSLSVTWFVLNDLQLRGAYGRTLSRPVFNELSPSFFFDPDSGQELIGNPELVPTTIDGFDIRAEWYPTTSETLTIGVFLKDYTEPLERTFLPQAGGGQTATFQNAESADVRGFEIGGRTEFGRLGDLLGATFLERVFLSANLALLDSNVTLSDQGSATVANRTLQGQADIVVNVQLGYDSEDHKVTLAYNHVGERLQRAGVDLQPDIIQDPIDVLDLNYTWSISESAEIKVSGSNLLNTTTRWTQQIEGQPEEVFREFQTGRTYGASFSWKFE